MLTYDSKGLRIKRCPKCGESKDETQWEFRDKAHTMFSTYCKPCDRVRKKLAARKRYSDKDKRKQENQRQRLWKYGIDKEKFNDLMTKAENSCQICKDTENLVIDHCHDSKKVRGILCWSCNIALGHFKDSKEKLEKAIKYLWTNQDL